MATRGRPPATAVERAIKQTEQNLDTLEEARALEVDHKVVLKINVSEVPPVEVQYELRRLGGEVLPPKIVMHEGEVEGQGPDETVVTGQIEDPGDELLGPNDTAETVESY